MMSAQLENDNLSAVLIEKGNLTLKQHPIPVPAEKDVLIAVHSVGICGSDVHYWKNGAIGDFIVKAPMILGHETSGTVVKIGSKVSSFKPGDRVAVEPGVPCRVCSFCKTGKYNLCPDVKFCATPPYDGTLTRYYVTPEDFCFKLPDNVTYEEGAFLEPLSVAVHACKRANVKIGSVVLICGAGPIGLLNLITAKAGGASIVCIFDMVKDRLDVAKKCGADYAVLIQDQEEPRELAEKIKNLLGCEPDITIECSGAEMALQAAIFATKSGGVVQMVGLGKDYSSIPVVNATVREVDLRGGFRYANCYPTALALIASGKVDVKPLVTHRFTLEETLKAFQTASDPKQNSIKVMIKCAKG